MPQRIPEHPAFLPDRFTSMLWFCVTLVREPHMRGFIEELRHRNVFRVAIAYVIIGWVFAQVADLAADAFNAPEWVMQMLIIFLLLGLPVALFLAWAFELTPEGVKKAKDLPADMPKDPRSGRVLNRFTIITLIIAVAWLGWDRSRSPSSDQAAVAVVDKSIAVLPFDDFSPGGDQAWFADGLTEEVLNSLARTSDLHVASRTSSFAYRNTAENISDIAVALGVAHILEGSVRRAGDQLRVTAQLIRASDDKHLWSDTFDGNVENSIGIQEEIATQIANALQTAMDPEELARMISAGTSSVAAWEVYLQGLAISNDAFARVDRLGYIEALSTFDNAVSIDPSFVDAHVELMQLWFSQLDNSNTSYSHVGPPYEERRARFDAALEASVRLARTDVERLTAEARKAEIEVRIKDRMHLLEQISALTPDSVFDTGRLVESYQINRRLDDARRAGERAWALPIDVNDPDDSYVFLTFQMRRLDVTETVKKIDEYFAAAKAAGKEPSAAFYYQAHRALLDAGEIERAAGLIDYYLLRSVDDAGKAIVQLRQACAEGRIEDAEAFATTEVAGPSLHWLIYKTLGQDDEARELLREYDTPEKLFILAGYLDYRAFDPRDYPLLWKTLRAQGIERAPVRQQTFRCNRTDA
jgi:TolB-like protein